MKGIYRPQIKQKPAIMREKFKVKDKVAGGGKKWGKKTKQHSFMGHA